MTKIDIFSAAPEKPQYFQPQRTVCRRRKIRVLLQNFFCRFLHFVEQLCVMRQVCDL